MKPVDHNTVLAVIQGYPEPSLNQDLFTAGCVTSLNVEGTTVKLELQLPFPADCYRQRLQQQLTDLLTALPGVRHVQINCHHKIDPAPVQSELESLSEVRNIVAVASGKGGVGKSTTAVNIALAMASEGARVGILDADIHGPSVGLMLGIADGTRPEVKNDRFFMPLEAHGIQAMSMAFLVTEETPVVWRGPMLSGALQQLLNQTLWCDLDYLFVDMPPGTGDVQLTLAQKVPVAGSAIVTTPQDLALIDARKGIEMFDKVNIPVLGVIENMALHRCSACGHVEHLFGEGGGERLAQQYGVSLLGSLPLAMSIREQVDDGCPTTVAEPESAVTGLYRDIARKLAVALWRQGQQQPAAPTISISED